ncbi:unnamed protein product [Rhodiola kirilowii]
MANMASLAISVPIHLSSSSSTTSKLTTHPPPHPKISSIGFSTSISQLGSSWNGLRFSSLTVAQHLIRKDRRMRRRCRGKVYASLFGVGAPEALVIGVVALLVFGPKGLAEVARNLGKTLRAFQPTIRELQDVSREFKSTLEREIGIDDIANPLQNTYSPSSTTRTPTVAPPPVSSSDTLQTPVELTDGSPMPSQAYTSEEYLKITEEQLKAVAASQQQEQVASTADDPLVSQQSGTVQESTAPPPPPAKLESDTPS